MVTGIDEHEFEFVLPSIPYFDVISMPEDVFGLPSNLLSTIECLEFGMPSAVSFVARRFHNHYVRIASIICCRVKGGL